MRVYLSAIIIVRAVAAAGVARVITSFCYIRQGRAGRKLAFRSVADQMSSTISS